MGYVINVRGKSVKNLINKLKNTSSSNEKIAILQTATPYEIEALEVCYDPFFQTNLKSAKPNKVGAFSFQQSWKLFEDILDKLNKRLITGNKAKEIVNNFLSQCDAETQEVYEMILKKDLRCGIGIKAINSAFGNLIQEFNVQLANTYLDSVEKKSVKSVGYYWASPKLDGIRCIFIHGRFYTRQGKPVYGFENIEAEINQILAKHPHIKFLDGELYSHEVPFQTIQSYVMSQKGEEAMKNKIKFHVFVMGAEYETTEDMIEDLSLLTGNYVVPIKYVRVSNHLADIRLITTGYEEQGYEGTMLRHPLNWYSWKRDDNLLKYKNFIEGDFTIVGSFEGKNDLTGTLGGLIIEGEYNGKKIKSEVGSGFKIKEEFPDNRKWFWDSREDIIGKTVEIKFQGITDEESEGFYSLRFPIYLKLKEDR